MPLPFEILPFALRWTLARPAALGLPATVRALPGVVEHGLFLDEAT